MLQKLFFFGGGGWGQHKNLSNGEIKSAAVVHIWERYIYPSPIKKSLKAQIMDHHAQLKQDYIYSEKDPCPPMEFSVPKRNTS